MPVRPLVPFTALLCMLALVHPASATTLYKWVDERGVTNYSDQPPASAVKQQPIADNRVSVYTPDPQLVRAVEAERTRAIEDLRTGRRARELQADWLARQYFAAAHAYPPDPCAGSADPRCGGSMVFGYVPSGGYPAPRRGLRILPQINLTPGATAGNVTADTGYIPGNSAFAPQASSAPRVMSAPGVYGGGGPRGTGPRR